ncbi:DNA polymerase [uncultured archaeon]|nr:DNA polymerase [uncultured archaeon]
MVRRKAVFLDADYVYRNKRTYARLLVKGKKTTRLYYAYDPYFLCDAVEKEADIAKIAVNKGGELVRVKRVEIVEKALRGENKKLLKVYCDKPADVVVLRQAIPFKCYEHGIHYSRRFMLDFNIMPFSVLEYEREGREIKKFLKIGENEKLEAEVPLRKLAFDIETYNPLGAPREKKDPVVMVSYASDSGKKGVFTYKENGKKFVHLCKDEKTMLADFDAKLAEIDPDIIYGYNSSNFDLPYIKARADILKLHLNLGRDGKGFRPVRKGMINGAKIGGRIHLDIYPPMRFFGFIGLVKAQEFTLEKMYEEMTGKKKKMVKRLNIWEIWDKGELDELAEYSLGDSEVTLELGEEILPLLTELSKLTRMPLFDTSLATSGQLVESLLMQESQLRNEVIPSKPSEAEAQERQENPIEGAFVKLPEPGIYENIAVFDFRGLYPSIIISYNIDPTSLVKDGGEEDVFTSPLGAKFRKKPQALIPHTLGRLLDLRAGIKKDLKKLDKAAPGYKKLYARSHALKILANSFYGYLGYARSRWYNRSCAESVTAWGRKHILDAAAKAEENGFRVLYADTDSLFLILGDKKKSDALAFLDGINKNLPEKMELELENFYSRGVFVSKKQEKEKGAKKKYAMLAEDGSIKIRGFELVRRDWSNVAKDAQYRVLEAILREGSKEKAVAIVKDTIERLKGGKVPMEDLTIYTQLTKKPEDYDIMSPELAAAKKARARGMPLEKGSVVSYVITKSGKTISEKAETADYAKDYDPDYYINNQVLPAVMKILKELGYSEDEMKNKGKQKNLGHFFE